MLTVWLSQLAHQTLRNSMDVDEVHRNDFSYNLIMFNIKRERMLSVILMILTFSVISMNVLTLDQKELRSTSI